jgi:two-component system cell cycle response regulator
MQVSLCDKYGFGKSARQQRLALFGLSSEDHNLALLLHDAVISTSKHQIVDQFYSFLLGQPDTATFISGPEVLERLKQTHTNYLESLGMDFDQEPYFENRLTVGLVHERIGLPLSLYQAAYCELQGLLLSSIPDKFVEEDKKNLTQFIIKITSLDMSLATETYHNILVGNLTSSIIDLRKEERRLTFKAKQDSMTKAASRDHILSVLENELAFIGKRTSPTCIAMVDLDHFKKVNDNYGHLVGDEILKGVVGRIRSRMRNLDLIGRYGGEEFLLVFPATDLTTAADIVDRIRKHVESSPFHVDEFSIPVTISAGVTAMNKNDTMDDVLDRADQLLYQAKNNGRNRVES